MKPGIDIVGHFGTTFSYATVASRVAQALAEREVLGTVQNLDPAWHPAHQPLRERASKERHTHVFVVSPPQHYLDVYPGVHGRDNAAIFLRPNTDTLAVEAAEATAMFGLAVAPSVWCAEVTDRALGAVGSTTEVICAPLGVDEALLDTREARRDQLALRLSDDSDSCTAVHFSTDQSWPGRKGTEELLEAWAIHEKQWDGDRLVLHIPPALSHLVAYRSRELELKGLDVRVGGSHGSDSGGLAALLDEADLLVAPSRCEGYGIMLASALVGGVPLLRTCETGQRDFLLEMPGRWMGVPTGTPGPIAGETGMAPTVDPQVLAHHLQIAMHPETLWMMVRADDIDFERHTWRSAAPHLATRLVEWMGRED